MSIVNITGCECCRGYYFLKCCVPQFGCQTQRYFTHVFCETSDPPRLTTGTILIGGLCYEVDTSTEYTLNSPEIQAAAQTLGNFIACAAFDFNATCSDPECGAAELYAKLRCCGQGSGCQTNLYVPASPSYPTGIMISGDICYTPEGSFTLAQVQAAGGQVIAWSPIGSTDVCDNEPQCVKIWQYFCECYCGCSGEPEEKCGSNGVSTLCNSLENMYYVDATQYLQWYNSGGLIGTEPPWAGKVNALNVCDKLLYPNTFVMAFKGEPAYNSPVGLGSPPSGNGWTDDAIVCSCEFTTNCPNGPPTVNCSVMKRYTLNVSGISAPSNCGNCDETISCVACNCNIFGSPCPPVGTITSSNCEGFPGIGICNCVTTVNSLPTWPGTLSPAEFGDCGTGWGGSSTLCTTWYKLNCIIISGASIVYNCSTQKWMLSVAGGTWEKSGGLCPDGQYNPVNVGCLDNQPATVTMTEIPLGPGLIYHPACTSRCD